MFLASKPEERGQEIFGDMEGGKLILHRNSIFEEQPKTDIVRHGLCAMRSHNFIQHCIV